MLSAPRICHGSPRARVSGAGETPFGFAAVKMSKCIGSGGRLIPLFSCVLLTAVIVTLTIEVIDIVEIELAAEQLTVSIGIKSQPQIRATRLRGKAVEQFRKHLDCFSQTGRWVYNDTPRYIPPKVWGDAVMGVCDQRWHNVTPGALSGKKANDVAAALAGNWKVREDLKWQWETDQSCPTVSFNRKDFCRKVGNRNILLVGDSITQEIFYIFMDYAEGNTTGITVPLRNHRTVQLRHKVCEDVVEGGFYVGYVRNDRLSLNINYIKWLRDKTGWTEFPWIHLMHEWNISLLLFNRGAHFENDGNYTEGLRNTYHVLQSRYPDVHVFFRSTPEGHVNCSEATGPLSKLPEGENLPYHWDQYRRQNKLAKEITEAMGYIFLDLSAAVSLRPEAHLRPADCLHYCLPGPLDVIIQMFYNVLLLLPQLEAPRSFNT